MSPGSMPAGSRDLWQEGLIIPPVRLTDDVLELICANSRTPRLRRGDFRAQVSANRVAQRRISELVDRRGLDTLLAGFEEVLRYAERRTREALRRLPDGTYRAFTELEGDGFTDEDIVVDVTVTVAGDTAHINFAGTAAAVEGNVNCPLAVTRSACYFALRVLLPEDVPANAGTYAPLTIAATEGSLVNAGPPHAVVAGNVETSQRIADAVLAALAAVTDVPAAGQGTMNNTVIGGRGWTYYETVGGGQGASSRGDGPSGVHVGMTNTLNTPIEALELEYPMRVERYELARGSGGAGHHRGGDGIIRSIRVLEDATINLLTDRRRHPPRAWPEAGRAASAVTYSAPRNCQRRQLAGSWPDRSSRSPPRAGAAGASRPDSRRHHSPRRRVHLASRSRAAEQFLPLTAGELPPSGRGHCPDQPDGIAPASRQAGTSHLRRSLGALDLPVVLPPDEPVHAEVTRQRTQTGDERQADEDEGQDGHQPPHQRIGVVGGGERLDLIPERIEPQPRLARPAAGLVHHPPLVTAEILRPGGVLQVGAVGQEEQRLGVVGGVEPVLGDQKSVQRAGLSEPEQPGHQQRDRAVVAGRDRTRVAAGSFSDGVTVGRRPLHLHSGRGRRPLGQGAGQHRVRGDLAQRPQYEVLRRVHSRPNATPTLQRQRSELLAGARGGVVWRPVARRRAGAVQFGDRGGHEVPRGGFRPASDGDRAVVGGAEQRGQRDAEHAHHDQRDEELLDQVELPGVPGPLLRRRVGATRGPPAPGGSPGHDEAPPLRRSAGATTPGSGTEAPAAGNGGTTPRRRTRIRCPAISAARATGSSSTWKSSI